MVQAFLKKWWVESDFKASNLPLSLRLKVSGCHYNSIYNKTGKTVVITAPNSVKWMSKIFLRHTLIRKYFWHFCCWPLIFIHFHYMKIHRLYYFLQRRNIFRQDLYSNICAKWWNTEKKCINSNRIYMYGQHFYLPFTVMGAAILLSHYYVTSSYKKIRYNQILDKRVYLLNICSSRF